MLRIHASKTEACRHISFCESAYKLAKRVVPEFSSKFSERTYTQPQHVAMLCLKVRDGETYDGIVDKINDARGKGSLGAQKSA